MKALVPTPGTVAGVQLEAVFQFPLLADPQEVCASVLNIPKQANKTATNRVLEKMRMQNSAELTHYAIKNRLVE